MANNYYRTLGVSEGATTKEIRQAFRRLARKYHPDVNPGDKASETRFKEINEAYQVLSDPESRQKYTRFGDNWKHADPFSQNVRGSRMNGFPWGHGSGSTFGSGINLDDIMQQFLGSQGSKQQTRRPNRKPNYEQNIQINLQEAAHGATRVIQIPTETPGKTRRLEVKIPPGVDNGSRVRVAPDSKQKSSYIHLKGSVNPHSTIDRKGSDLFTNANVPLVDAILGGEVEIATLDEKIALKIPAKTQNGTTFRLSGKGMPSIKPPNQRGSLYVNVHIILPTDLSERELKLFQELKTIGDTKG